MTIAREEIFGPVVSVITYDDEEDAGWDVVVYNAAGVPIAAQRAEDLLRLAPPGLARVFYADNGSSAIAGRASRSGTSRATADSTFGGGRNAPDGTVKSRVTAKRDCSMTVRRP